MVLQVFRLPVEGKEGLDRVIDIGLDDCGTEATIIFCVVNQQGRSRSAHRRHCGEILTHEYIGGCLLALPAARGKRGIQSASAL